MGKMFENLKVFNLNGLNECELRNLGQINVICGKNNSGKSTILEAINNPIKRSHGKVISSEKKDVFYSKSIVHLRYRDHPQQSTIYKNIVHEIFTQKEVWYEYQAMEFSEKLLDAIEEYGILGHYQFPTASIANIFTNLFSFNADTLLIPPKRILELSKKIDADENIQSNGLGVLNKLFFYRSQHEGTRERKLFDLVRTHFAEISNGYTFDIKMGNSTVAVLNFSRGENDWIPASNCGLGLQDLLILLWFAIDPNKNILLIEEPESHMHPEMQRKVLEFFRTQKEKQFIITSHSNVFVNSAYADKVFYTNFEEDIKVYDATNRAAVLSNLGYSVTDNLVSDLVILVEGPKDVPVIEEFLIKMRAYTRYAIKIWPLGGDIMDQLDLSVFSENYKLIALIDNDPLSNNIRTRFIDKCKDYNIPIHKTNRYSIENYFSLRALREVFENQIDSGIKEIKPDEKLEKQIGINVKNNNRKIAQLMTLDEIAETDLETFLHKVIEICKS